MIKIKVFVLVAIALLMEGCMLLENPLFWKYTIGGIIRAAYHSGGAQLVNEKVDALEEEGKIDSNQAEKIKEAAQNGYDKLQEKLYEENINDVILEDCEV